MIWLSYPLGNPLFKETFKDKEMNTETMFSFIILAVVLLLGLEHAIEPDHIATLRLLHSKKEYIKFGLTHGLGFVLIAIPLVILFDINSLMKEIGYGIGILIGVLLLYSALSNKEIEFTGSIFGIAQGAFALTPSKVLVAVIVASVGLLYGSLYLLTFVIVSSLAIIFVGMFLDKISIIAMHAKAFNIVVALLSIVYSAYYLYAYWNDITNVKH